MTVLGCSSPLLSAPRNSPLLLEILRERVPLLKFVSTQTLNLDTEEGHFSDSTSRLSQNAGQVNLRVCPSKTVSSEACSQKTGNKLGTDWEQTTEEQG